MHLPPEGLICHSQVDPAARLEEVEGVPAHAWGAQLLGACPWGTGSPVAYVCQRPLLNRMALQTRCIAEEPGCSVQCCHRRAAASMPNLSATIVVRASGVLIACCVTIPQWVHHMKGVRERATWRGAAAQRLRMRALAHLQALGRDLGHVALRSDVLCQHRAISPGHERVYEHPDGPEITP